MLWQNLGDSIVVDPQRYFLGLLGLVKTPPNLLYSGGQPRPQAYRLRSMASREGDPKPGEPGPEGHGNVYDWSCSNFSIDSTLLLTPVENPADEQYGLLSTFLRRSGQNPNDKAQVTRLSNWYNAKMKIKSILGIRLIADAEVEYIYNRSGPIDTSYFFCTRRMVHEVPKSRSGNTMYPTLWAHYQRKPFDAVRCMATASSLMGTDAHAWRQRIMEKHGPGTNFTEYGVSFPDGSTILFVCDKAQFVFFRHTLYMLGNPLNVDHRVINFVEVIASNAGIYMGPVLNLSLKEAATVYLRDVQAYYLDTKNRNVKGIDCDFEWEDYFLRVCYMAGEYSEN